LTGAYYFPLDGMLDRKPLTAGSQRRFSSVVEQLIRNERVISSNLISGSPLDEEFYLLKSKDFGGISA
jgi:hypothetical protein